LEQFSISTMVVDSRKIVVGGVGMGSIDLKLRGMKMPVSLSVYM